MAFPTPLSEANTRDIKVTFLSPRLSPEPSFLDCFSFGPYLSLTPPSPRRPADTFPLASLLFGCYAVFRVLEPPFSPLHDSVFFGVFFLSKTLNGLVKVETTCLLRFSSPCVFHPFSPLHEIALFRLCLLLAFILRHAATPGCPIFFFSLFSSAPPLYVFFFYKPLPFEFRFPLVIFGKVLCVTSPHDGPPMSPPNRKVFCKPPDGDSWN